MIKRAGFHPYAIATILFWSLAYVLTRLALQYFSALSLGFLRYLFASCSLLIIALATKMKLPRRADLQWIMLSGVTGFFLYMIAFNLGQKTVSASTGSVVLSTVPVITALFARFLYQEKLRTYQWVAIAIEFLGVAVLALMKGVFSVNLGLLWLLVAALALSAYNLIQRRLIRTCSSFQSATYSIFFGTLLLSVFAPISAREISSAPGIQFVYLAILGVFSSALAYAAWAKAFSLAKQTSQVSNYMFFTPFLTSLLGFVLAGEVPDGATLLGGGIILLGVFLFNFGGRFFKAQQRPLPEQ